MVIDILSAYEIAEQAETAKTARANRLLINKLFRKQDQSNLPPVLNEFNYTERAIRRAQWFMRETGNNLMGLEYAYFLESAITTMVNEI